MTGVELAGVVTHELGSKTHEVIFWTDSTSVLQYVCSTAKKYKTFVLLASQLFRLVLSPRNGGMYLPKAIPLILPPEV